MVQKNLAFSALAEVRNLSIANPDHAPYGQAAKEALIHERIWDRFGLGRLWRERPPSLQFAETGNADAAIVAWSLVKDKGGQFLPAEWHNPIRQSAAHSYTQPQRRGCATAA